MWQVFYTEGGSTWNVLPRVVVEAYTILMLKYFLYMHVDVAGSGGIWNMCRHKRLVHLGVFMFNILG